MVSFFLCVPPLSSHHMKRCALFPLFWHGSRCVALTVSITSRGVWRENGHFGSVRESHGNVYTSLVLLCVLKCLLYKPTIKLDKKTFLAMIVTVSLQYSSKTTGILGTGKMNKHQTKRCPYFTSSLLLLFQLIVNASILEGSHNKCLPIPRGYRTSKSHTHRIKSEGFHSKESRVEIWTHMTANNRNIKVEPGPNLIISNAQQ